MIPEQLGPSDLERISKFLEPIFLDTYQDKVVNGRAAAKSIFDKWDSPEALGRKYASGVRYFSFYGTALLALKVEEDGILYIDKLYVSEDSQGKGIGTEAMRFAVLYGREHRCDVIATHINALNKAAESFYGRFGMKTAVTVHRCHDGGEYDYAYLVGAIDRV